MNNFEWNIYLNQNPDLVENNINTKEKAFIHFKMHGKNEKRFYNKKMVDLWENYDWNKYKNNNPKLNSLDEACSDEQSPPAENNSLNTRDDKNQQPLGVELNSQVDTTLPISDNLKNK